MFTYANALGEEKRLAPTDDIVTAIVNAEVDGERLSDMEFDMFFMLLSVAGNETTRNAITHGMLAFLEHRDQWEHAAREPRALRPGCRGDRAVGEPGDLLPALGDEGRGAAGSAAEGRDKITVWYSVGEP